MKVEIGNSIVETEDIREITIPSTISIFFPTPNGGKTIGRYGFIIKFYQGRGEDMNIYKTSEYDSEPCEFLATHQELVDLWSKNQPSIRKFKF